MNSHYPRIIRGLYILALVVLGACTVPKQQHAQPELPSIERSTESLSATITLTELEEMRLPATATSTPSPPADTLPNPSPTIQPLCPSKADADQRCYQDLDYGFALNFPVTWEEAIITINQDQPYEEPEKIVRRHTVHGPEGYLHIDILDTRAARTSDLKEWLDWDAKRREVLHPITQPNATVAGYPAVIYLEEGPDGVLSVILSNEKQKRVYWLVWTVTCVENWPAVVRQMLDSLRFSQEEAVKADIPGEVWQVILRASERSINPGFQDQPCPCHPLIGCP